MLSEIGYTETDSVTRRHRFILASAVGYYLSLYRQSQHAAV